MEPLYVGSVYAAINIPSFGRSESERSSFSAAYVDWRVFVEAPLPYIFFASWFAGSQLQLSSDISSLLGDSRYRCENTFTAFPREGVEKNQLSIQKYLGQLDLQSKATAPLY